MKWIGIVGSRRRCGAEDFYKVEKAFLEVYGDGDKIVSGGCPKGGDRFAELIAKKYGAPILIYYPKWQALGVKAGFARNTCIAYDADVLIACVAPDRAGGTEDTIKKFEKTHPGKKAILA